MQKKKKKKFTIQGKVAEYSFKNRLFWCYYLILPKHTRSFFEQLFERGEKEEEVGKKGEEYLNVCHEYSKYHVSNDSGVLHLIALKSQAKSTCLLPPHPLHTHLPFHLTLSSPTN